MCSQHRGVFILLWIVKRVTIKKGDTMEINKCAECENYKFAILERRRQRIYSLVKFIAVLAFVAVLVVSFESYKPCLLLFLLLL